MPCRQDDLILAGMALRRADVADAAVAIAAKNARMAWAVLAKGDNFAMPA